MATPLTGDIANRVEAKKVGVTLHNFPKALTADLTAKASTLNDKTVSGKRLGAQIMVVDSLTAPTTAAVYVAAGSSTVAKWVPSVTVLGAAQTTAVTPA